MSRAKQFSDAIHQVYFGGNWTEVNLKDTISTFTWQIACRKTEGFNSILALTFHIHYFLKVQLRVLEEGILVGNDSESYKHPDISSQLEWTTLQSNIWNDAERFTELLTKLPESMLDKPFINKKYGTYAYNIQGLIEHTHYHLGQIVILKKVFK